ncbi:hypothetical protein [Streptomyces sp. NPDC047028]|uniref:hypothetical protein n=1 Tax=Streptomyces sp. NPDC047028 TaxID=3155793 RepID=UPI0033FD1A28
MPPGRPTRPSPPARRGDQGRRAARAAALGAGAALGLATLVAPFTATGAHAAPTPDAVALAADASAPSVTLGTGTVEAGGEVSFTATGFPAGATLTVKFDDKTLLKQFAIGADGSVSASVTVPADAAAGTGHWLRFLAPQTSVRSADLTVTPAAPPPPSPIPTPTPTPTPKPIPTPGPSTPASRPAVKLAHGGKVAAGGKVSFSLTGFRKGQTVTVKLDDTAILAQWKGAVRADGTFSGTVTVPARTSAGAHWLRFLAPDPPTSLKADLTVTSSGTGGGSGGGGGEGGSTDGGNSSGGGDDSGSGGGSGGGSTGGSGGGSGGSSGDGSGGGSDTSQGASVTITAGSSVTAGGKVSFRVTGFPAGRQLTVKLDDSTIIGQWPGGIAADGSLSASVTIPRGTTSGAHWLRFLAPDPPTSLRADFTVTSGGTSGSGTAGGSGGGSTAGGGSTTGGGTPVPAASGAPAAASDSRGATARITADQVQPGGKLHFTVTAFPARRTLTIKLDDDAILGQWKTDAQGAYEGDVTIPPDTSAGAHWLRFLAPDPPTTLKVDFTATAPGTAAAVTGTAPSSGADDATTTATAPVAAPMRADVSYATIAWSAAAAAAGGAAGAAATTLLVVRRRTTRPPQSA